MSLGVDTSKGSESYNVSVTNPYHTLDGISRTVSVSRRRIDAADLEISNYLLNTDIAALSYGIPLSELSRLNGGISYDNSELVTSVNTSDEIKEYVANNNDGDSDYKLYKLSGSWVYDSRNKPLIADEGARIILNFEGSFPGSDLEFYKLGFDYTQYFSITEGYTFLYNLEVDYGQPYGETTELPPFERFYVGGSRSVRGFEANSIGNQRDSNGDPIGGDRSLVSNLELILPNPFSERSEELRFSAFIDAGFVWAPGEKLDLGELRYSAGVSMIWIAPIGLMRFSLAEALNPEPTDELSAFQFTLGTLF
jgi:outer membrane protein insertion porin family